ncbi:MAG: hypothetical protein AAF298_02120 [Cyanobacteria bacterium P01_A01_bin.40]
MEEKRIYEVATLGEFLWKTSMYIRYGYVRYALRIIPEHKDPSIIAKKLLLHYDCTYNRDIRKQRLRQGKANVVLLCFGHQFLLLATNGEHPEFEKIDSLTFNENPLQFSGYSIGVKQGKPYIQMTSRRFRGIKKTLSWMAVHDHNRVTRYMKEISPFSFKGVSDQRWKLIKLVNQKRKKAGLSRIRWSDISKSANQD